MIKSNHGNVNIEGAADELCADFSCITSSLNEVFSEAFGKDEAKKLINTSYEDGFKTNDEIEAEIEAELAKLKAAHKDMDKRLGDIKKMSEEILNG